MKIFKITILNWDKHNANRKKSYKYTLIANNMIHDSRLRVVPVPVRWMWLGLLLTCGDLNRDTIETSERQVRDMLESSWSVERALQSLQSLQLLTFELMNFPLILNVKKGNVKKGNVKKGNVKNRIVSTLEKSDTDLNAEIKNAYIDAYRLRYGIEPQAKGPKFNGQISGFRKNFGVDECISIINFYLTHNDGIYLKASHSIGLCILHADSLRTQMLRGKAITTTMVRAVEKKIESQERSEQISNMWEK